MQKGVQKNTDERLRGEVRRCAEKIKLTASMHARAALADSRTREQARAVAADAQELPYAHFAHATARVLLQTHTLSKLRIWKRANTHS
eukprot:3763448-Pleurochrysis_carterae.AAC.1